MLGVAATVKILNIDGKSTKEFSCGKVLPKKTVCILLSPYNPKVTPLTLSAQIDAFQQFGMNVSVAILGNYNYTFKTEKGVDCSRFHDEGKEKELLDFYREGKEKLATTLDEEFDPKKYPTVTYRRVFKDHKVNVLFGKDFEEKEGFQDLKLQYDQAINDDGSTLFAQRTNSVDQFTAKHHTTISEEVRKHNSEMYFNLEGPQYAMMSKLSDFVAYMSCETDVLHGCRLLVPEGERAGYIECQLSNSVNIIDVAPEKLARIRRNNCGISRIIYSLPSPAISETPRIIMRKAVEPFTKAEDYEGAHKALIGLENEDWEEGDLTYQEELLVKIEEAIALKAREIQTEIQTRKTLVKGQIFRFFGNGNNGNGRPASQRPKSPDHKGKKTSSSPPRKLSI